MTILRQTKSQSLHLVKDVRKINTQQTNQKDRFIDQIDKTISRLSEQKEFIEEALAYPEVLFADAQGVFSKGAKDTVFSIMSIYEDDRRKMSVHEFQSFLCQIINKFFKEELKNERISVRPRDQLRFPSIFAIYHDSKEIVQFDIFKKYYGKRDFRTIDEIKNRYVKMLDEFKSRELQLKEKISRYEFFKMNKLEWIRDYYQNKNTTKNKIKRAFLKLSDYYLIYFRTKKADDYLEMIITKTEKELESHEIHYAHCNRYQQELDDCERFLEVLPSIEMVFMDYRYRLETRKDKLY